MVFGITRKTIISLLCLSNTVVKNNITIKKLFAMLLEVEFIII